MTAFIKANLNKSDRQMYIDKHRVAVLLILKKQIIFQKSEKKLDKYVVEKPEYNIDKPMMTDFIIERSRLLCGAYFIVSKDTKVL